MMERINAGIQTLPRVVINVYIQVVSYILKTINVKSFLRNVEVLREDVYIKMLLAVNTRELNHNVPTILGKMGRSNVTIFQVPLVQVIARIEYALMIVPLLQILSVMLSFQDALLKVLGACNQLGYVKTKLEM